MLNKILKRIICPIVSVILLCSGLLTSAAGADNAYTYDSWGNTVDVPSGFEEEFTVGNAEDIRLKSPMDMYYRNGVLYVLDSGNNRVVLYNENFEPIKTIEKFYTVENNENKYTELNEAQGIFVTDDGKIAIADTANARVIICNRDGLISTVLTKSETENFPDTLQFKPIKVVIDDINNVYVLADGFYYGAIVYDAQGNYKNFYGASKVKASAALIADMFWRKFMTGKQLDYTRNYLPSAFTSLDIDNKNFIYTIIAEKSGAIRKLNYLGNDIFEVEQGPIRLTNRFTAITEHSISEVHGITPRLLI